MSRSTGQTASSLVGGGEEPVGTIVRAGVNLEGKSDAWLSAHRLVRRIAENDATSLIEGETGTGKELVARAIHYWGKRSNFPFVPLNCGAIPDGLLEAELFGHERGAFTDARERRAGLIAEACGGTMFLDEVEAMSQRAQVVLLRFLQDQTYLPLGARTAVAANVRIIAATNEDLVALAGQGRFRQDLLFRLRVLHVRLPPLRTRVGDVALLAQTFLDRFSQIHGRPRRRLVPGCIPLLERYSWPGNVRELENLVLRELLMQDGDDEELAIRPPCSVVADVTSAPAANFKQAKARAVADFERSFMLEALTNAGGNVSLAARLVQKDRRALTRLAKKHGFRLDEFRPKK